MKARRPSWAILGSCLTLAATLLFGSCGNVLGQILALGAGPAPQVVNLMDIPGVIAPATGATPVTAVDSS